eukprot:CAMPEP_0117683850 /NCGR_PEP_ID=MMETSP0804-20121206/20685_1 /TAXON_ID=1074897 /ORGANISM="Tetraselmis astigmatica, Strain CCMP880" /LENGTH=98 /DNA_ID=CAMNT_0005494601 /DNA_START=71 /DNA_END=367 /DNA_ORIENTATION=-
MSMAAQVQISPMQEADANLQTLKPSMCSTPYGARSCTKSPIMSTMTGGHLRMRCSQSLSRYLLHPSYTDPPSRSCPLLIISQACRQVSSARCSSPLDQ